MESSIADGKLAEGIDTVRGMAQFYDGTISYANAEWGSRSRVLVAINGFYFNASTGEPWSGMVQSGWFAKRFWESQSVSGFAWTLNRQAFIGECIYYPGARNVIVVDGDEANAIKFHALNEPREADQLVIYTPQWDDTTRTDNDGVEVLVEMQRPNLILPWPHRVLGTVTAIRDGKGSTPIPFDSVVLSGNGLSRSKLLNAVQVGSQIGISHELDNCPVAPAYDWTKTYTGIGADFIYLKDGQPRLSPSNENHNVPAPRTALAYNDEYLFFIVVDGRHPGVSEGLSAYDVGVFARDVLSATQGVTLDSGGSPTMVVEGELVNNTYCNFTWQCDPSAADLAELTPLPNAPGVYDVGGALWDAEAVLLEPLVANGLMMVAVSPPMTSTLRAPGQQFVFPDWGEVRLGPGSNYGLLATLPPGTVGEIIPHAGGLNGLLVQGRFWWRMDFNDAPSGWIALDAPYQTYLPLSPREEPATHVPAVRRRTGLDR